MNKPASRTQRPSQSCTTTTQPATLQAYTPRLLPVSQEVGHYSLTHSSSPASQPFLHSLAHPFTCSIRHATRQPASQASIHTGIPPPRRQTASQEAAREEQGFEVQWSGRLEGVVVAAVVVAALNKTRSRGNQPTNRASKEARGGEAWRGWA